ncbi:MAG: hypothetical protein JWO33_1651 [Caulobacteraceae bacterium]|nr:hypothetical protein [Caulobacteraceae bacterium]
MVRRLRFAVVTVVGFGVDFGLTLGLRQGLQIPLELAAAAGFVTALCLNYLLFEFWAFGAERAQLSGARIAGTGVAAALALGVRLAVIWLTQQAIGDSGLLRTVVAILIGALASLAVNYLMVSRVFSRR